MSESYLADNLRSLREAKKYSQKYISEQLHIARQTYTVYESGNRVPDINLICKLADIYDVSLDQLVLTDLSAHSDLIADGADPRHYAAVPNKSLIPLSGANAKAISSMGNLLFVRGGPVRLRRPSHYQKSGAGHSPPPPRGSSPDPG